MTVYVDSPKHKIAYMKMCQMTADTESELLEMAESIGLSRINMRGRSGKFVHFDVSKPKRKKAISLGAVEVSSKELTGSDRQKKRRRTR
jgi:hypothetical protein